MRQAHFSSHLFGIFIASALNASHANIPVYDLENFTVSAGPTARPIDDFANPFSILDADDIQRSSAGTLGELLNDQPGVSASSFGGGASRPIIRGFDGPRVRIVESGLGSQDVSETSPDHATTIEPLLTQRVEVLRGPSTLLYGSSAIGGVVNVVGREMPREQPTRQLSGAVEARYDSVSEGDTYLGYGTFAEGPLVLTLQGLKRKKDNYEIPGEAEIHSEHDDHDDDHEHEHSGDRLDSSFVENQFYSLGASWFLNQRNYIGFAVSGYDASYGVPGHNHSHHDDHDHDDHDHDHDHGGGVAIEMERTRFDSELAIFGPTNWIEALRVRFGYTDYEHIETHSEEEGHDHDDDHDHEEGTIFEREGWELRAEASHYEWTIFDQGIFGIQISDTDFAAAGEEIESDDGLAFGPPSKTRTQAIFISEHIHGEHLHLDIGGRLERQTIDVSGNDYSDIATSLAFGAIWKINEQNSLALSLQRTERHPNATELYANGPHLATSRFEVGDADLGLETAYGADISIRHANDEWNVMASVFYTYFDNYIFSADTGDEEDGLPVLNYTEVEALFYGIELEMNYLLYQSADTRLSVGLLADYVRAKNEDDNTDLPRIPPLRLGGKAELAHGNWNAGLLLRHSFKQNDTAPEETNTDGYTELQAEIGYVFDINSRSRLTVFARANNLLDEEIRHHTSFVKDQAPRPGRNFTLGARVEF